MRALGRHGSSSRYTKTGAMEPEKSGTRIHLRKSLRCATKGRVIALPVGYNSTLYPLELGIRLILNVISCELPRAQKSQG